MKMPLKWLAFGVGLLTLAGLLFFSFSGPAAAAPQLQMTPGVDPMSAPTVVAPALDAQNGLPGTTYTGTLTNSASCPMMSGSMGSMTGMGGMGGMAGMTGMTGMSGMSGMAGMSGMSGSMPMSSMGNMPMAGMMDIDDALAESQGGFLGITNPWWLVGWIVVAAMLVGLLAFLVLGLIWMVRQLRKEKPTMPAGG